MISTLLSKSAFPAYQSQRDPAGGLNPGQGPTAAANSDRRQKVGNCCRTRLDKDKEDKDKEDKDKEDKEHK